MTKYLFATFGIISIAALGFCSGTYYTKQIKQPDATYNGICAIRTFGDFFKEYVNATPDEQVKCVRYPFNFVKPPDKIVLNATEMVGHLGHGVQLIASEENLKKSGNKMAPIFITTINDELNNSDEVGYRLRSGDIASDAYLGVGSFIGVQYTFFWDGVKWVLGSISYPEEQDCW